MLEERPGFSWVFVAVNDGGCKTFTDRAQDNEVRLELCVLEIESFGKTLNILLGLEHTGSGAGRVNELPQLSILQLNANTAGPDGVIVTRQLRNIVGIDLVSFMADKAEGIGLLIC